MTQAEPTRRFFSTAFTSFAIATLRNVHTSGVAKSLLDLPNPFNAIFGSALFGNTRRGVLVAANEHRREFNISPQIACAGAFS